MNIGDDAVAQGGESVLVLPGDGEVAGSSPASVTIKERRILRVIERGLMTALHPNQHDSHAARRQRWACDRCGEQPLSEEIDLYFATGLCSWCSHLLAKDDA
jgi:hypothetical protein